VRGEHVPQECAAGHEPIAVARKGEGRGPGTLVVRQAAAVAGREGRRRFERGQPDGDDGIHHALARHGITDARALTPSEARQQRTRQVNGSSAGPPEAPRPADLEPGVGRHQVGVLAADAVVLDERARAEDRRRARDVLGRDGQSWAAGTNALATKLR